MQLFMNTSIKGLLVDKIISISLWVSISFYIISLGIIALTYSHLPPFLPIYNKLAWGYARLGHTYEIIIPVGIPILLSFLNIMIAKFIYAKMPLLARFLFLVTLLISLFTFIFIIKLTLIIL